MVRCLARMSSTFARRSSRMVGASGLVASSALDAIARPRRLDLVNPCRATSSPSNMTAARSSAGSARRTALRCSRRSRRRSLVFSGETVVVKGAGRTDAGVHALGQVAHIDLARDWTADTVRDAINAHLRPAPVAILAAEAVRDGFDARFSAVKRHYLYRILDRRAPPVLDRGRVWHVRHGSTWRRCTRRHRRWSATTTSPRSARPSARRTRR